MLGVRVGRREHAFWSVCRVPFPIASEDHGRFFLPSVQKGHDGYSYRKSVKSQVVPGVRSREILEVTLRRREEEEREGQEANDKIACQRKKKSFLTFWH